jgi:hypothetical protein
MKTFRPLLALSVIALFGAGCMQAPKPSADAPFFKIPEPAKQEAGALPCLSFEKAEGFAAWLDSYEAGKEDGVNLAKQAHLPEKADAKLMHDMRASLMTGTLPSFVCVLDDKGQNVAWVIEPVKKDTKCRDAFFVSIKGAGTRSDLTAESDTSDCRQLCKPKQQLSGALIWQCDIHEIDGKKAWTQLSMSRDTGVGEAMKCQKDSLGMPVGCVE